MKASTHSTPTKGFALLITITLLAFLVLLLVSLASLTRVETQVASNNQNLAQARQNALMALNIALGELQKYTGPDQRTTARSDILDIDSNPATFTPPPNGRWLGAYGSGAPAGYTQTPATTAAAVIAASDTKGSQAKLLNWLVSGNESTAFSPLTHVGTTGNITTAPSAFQFTPTAAVNGLSASVDATTNTLTIKDNSNTDKPARLLVGANTVGNSLTDYVVAPVREISGVVPGIGTTAVPIGHYAWWVGDESAKARFNLPMSQGTQAPNAFVSSQRAAVELVDAFNPSSSTSLSSAQMLDPAGTASRYDPSSSNLTKLISTDQLTMLAPSASTTLGTVQKYRYHDLTLVSNSVLSDTYAGGLKKDLSSLLVDTTHASPFSNTDFIFTTQPTSGSFTANEFGVPTWGMLRAYVNKTISNTNDVTVSAPGLAKITGRVTPTMTSAPIAPVMTYATLGFTYGVPIDTPLTPDTSLPGNPLTHDIAGNPIRLAALPIVVLWNPYTIDIKSAYYEVGFRKKWDANFELQAAPNGSIPWTSDWYDTSTSAPNPNVRILDWKTLDGYNGSSDPYIRFLIEAPAIPKGQSLVFTLENTNTPFSQSGYNCRLTWGYRRLNHALMPNVTAAIPSSRMIYRVGANGTNSFGASYRSYFAPEALMISI